MRKKNSINGRKEKKMKFNLDEIRAKAEVKSNIITWIKGRIDEEYGWLNPESGNYEPLSEAAEGTYGYELYKAYMDIAQNLK